MADTLQLHEGEIMEKELQGDYWVKSFCFYSQKRGKYWFTNERLIFQGGFMTELDIPYAEIESVKACNVGPLFPFLPTGVKVTTKSGESYKLSVLKRKSIIEFLETKI